MQQRMAKYQIPGIGFCIVKGNTTVWSNAYGWANLANGEPFTTEAIMNIASVSKTVTATAIMQLWEDGQVKLDDDISAYLPGTIRNPYFPDHPITIRQLLTHTSSIQDGPAYTKSYACGDPVHSLQYWITNYLMEQGIYYDENENFLENPPGGDYHYSNVGYGLLGYIVEELTGTPFQEYCRNSIFKPLKMQNTGWFLRETSMSRQVIPYVYIDEDNREEMITNFSHLFSDEQELQVHEQYATCLYSFPNYPDGGLRTSLSELSHFLVAFINGGIYEGSRILEKATINKMLSLQIGGNTSQGLCWHRSEFEALWGHGGADPGVRTHMYFSPENKIGVIVFQNNNRGDSFELLKSLYNFAR
jgi:CubicO group peptidase (beta-lactamase class C family)